MSEELFNNFQRYRMSRMYTQTYLANLIGTSCGYYGYKEKGIKEFNLSEAHLISKELGITIDEMYNKLTTWERETQ